MARRSVAQAAGRPRPSHRRSWLLPLLVFVATTIALMPKAVAGQATYAATDLIVLGSPYRDVEPGSTITNIIQTDVTEILPWTAAFQREARGGVYQRWDHHIAGGVPTGTLAIYSILSPFSVPYLVLPAWYAVTAKVALLLLFSQAGTYSLCRVLGIGRLAGVVAAVAYTFCGTNLAFLHRVSAVAVAPALLASAVLLARRATPARIVAFGALVAWSWHEGFPAAAVFNIYAALALFAWLGFGIIRRSNRRLREFVRLGSSVGGALVIGLGLCAVTMVSFLGEVTERGYITQGYRQYTSNTHLDPAAAFGMFDLSATGPLYDGPWFTIPNTIEGLGLVGSISLVGALGALVLAVLGRLRLADGARSAWGGLLLVGGVSLVGSYLGTALLGLLYRVPGIANNPFFRSRYLIALVAAILAAVVVDHVWTQRDALATTLRRGDRILAGALLAAMAAIVALGLRPFVDKVGEFNQGLNVRQGFLIAALLAAMAWAVLRAGVADARTQPFMAVGLVVLVWVQLAWPMRDFNPQVPVSQYYARTPGHDTLDAITGPSSRFWGSGIRTFYPNGTQLNGGFDLRGAGLQDAEFVPLVRLAMPVAFDRDPFKVIAAWGEVDFSSPALDHLAVRAVVLSSDEQPQGTIVPAPPVWDRWVDAATNPDALRVGALANTAGVNLPVQAVGECRETTVRLTATSSQGQAVATRPGSDLISSWTYFALPMQDVPAGEELQLALTADDPACRIEVGVIDDRVAIGYFTLARDAPLRLVSAEYGVYYERPSAFPIVSVHQAWADHPDDATATAAVATWAPGDPIPIAESSRPSGSISGTSSVISSSFPTNRIEATVDSDEGALVMISINGDDGWTASVNGESVPIERVDGALMGVFVGRGTSDIELHYRPRPWVLGATITMATVLLSVGALGLTAGRERRRRRDGGGDIGPG
jgi:hypothetical protein